MTRDQEVSKWYAEQMGSGISLNDRGTIIGWWLGDIDNRRYFEGNFDINDPACQMKIIEWCDAARKELRTVPWRATKHGRTGKGKTLKDALIALWGVMKDEQA